MKYEQGDTQDLVLLKKELKQKKVQVQDLEVKFDEINRNHRKLKAELLLNEKNLENITKQTNDK